MKKAVFKLRYLACLMWMVAGVLSGGISGYMSSVASLLFIVAMTLEASKK